MHDWFSGEEKRQQFFFSVIFFGLRLVVTNYSLFAAMHKLRVVLMRDSNSQI